MNLKKSKLLFSSMKITGRGFLRVLLGSGAVVCFIVAMIPTQNVKTAAVDLPKDTVTETASAPSDKPKDLVKDIASGKSSPTLLEKVAALSDSKEAKDNKNTTDNWQTIPIKPKDTLGKIFARNGYSIQDLHQMLKTPDAEKLKTLKPGKVLKLNVAEDKKVHGLSLELGLGSTLVVARVGDKFQVEHKQLPLEKQIAFGKGKIQTSLFTSAKKAGLDSKLISQMVEIFGWNIDFSLLKPNDTFRILFEEKYLDGERVETGHILAVELINNGKKHQAVRYTDKSGNTGYFSPEGYGMHQAFLRNPLNFIRISSGFGNRRHPILHKMRQHKGVDYSAPTGTPVHSTGDAKVIFAGNRRGYGKVIELQHGARYSTLYAHLSRFAKNVKIGTSVKQGQVIGFVGATGLATGPHLHYEFRIDGIHRDPLTVTLPKKNPIPETHKPHFMAHAQEMLRMMDVHESKVKVARNEFSSDE